MSQAFILKNGELVSVTPSVTVQIASESDLQSDAMKKLEPTSMAYTPGWKKAWQKKEDGTWESMV